MKYLANLTAGRIILWCYFIWYANVLARYFDPSPWLWLTSVGLSVIIGTALVISATSGSRGTTKLEGWQTFRLFLMPFCVSSFAALVKGRGFILVFPPMLRENLITGGMCAVFVLIALVIKRLQIGK